jgi:hypothetical protein
MSKLDSANAIGLPSRRLFLTRATAGLAGGLVAAAALAAPALAALPAAPVVDPVIALAERFLEADRESHAAYIAVDEFEPMRQWRKENPRPAPRSIDFEKPPYRNAHGKYVDAETGAPLSDDDGVKKIVAMHVDACETIHREHAEALRKWKRRRQAAERRTGYRKLWQANEEARQRFHEAQDALSDAIPLTWTGLAAKARAFRKTYGDSEHNLMRALMLDIAVLSGQLDRGSARPEGDEEYANV